MIIKCKRPDCFNHLEDGFLYYKLFDKNGAYAHAAFTPNKISIVHLDVERFNHNILKLLICDWETYKIIMQSYGVKDFVITKEGNLESNKSYVKFLSKFGLSAPHEILIAKYEVA